MLDIIETHNGFEVSFQYKPWLVNGIKLIPGAGYRKRDGKSFWWVPASSGHTLLNWAKTFQNTKISEKPVQTGEIEPLPELTIDIPLQMSLFNYQRGGVAYNMAKKRVIVGDQPGLGKTAQAIATAVGVQAKCILIICPATLKENWKSEWKMWTGRNTIIMRDSIKESWKEYYKTGLCNVFIVNYESLKKYFVLSIDKPEGKPLRINHIQFRETISLFDFIIIDEIHRTKDGKTMQSKLTMGICKDKEYRLGLTGTAVISKPADLIAQLAIIGKLQEFGGYKGFTDRYCQGSSQASNLNELNYLLHKHCFYRREKKEVLKDLPDKIRSIVRVDITNRIEYSKAEKHFIEYLRDNLKKSDGDISKSLRAEVMVQMGILKKISAKGKLEAVLEHIHEIVEAEEKIVVFAWHREMVAEMKRYIPGSVTIVGDDSMDDRQQSINRFQNDKKTQVIICNIKSGGVGITLTAASRVSFIELPWHAADSDQCEDRCHRIGQKDSVHCTYFLGHNTIDEYIYNLIEKKRAIANQIVGAEDNIETNMVDEFINLFMKDKK